MDRVGAWQGTEDVDESSQREHASRVRYDAPGNEHNEGGTDNPAPPRTTIARNPR